MSAKSSNSSNPAAEIQFNFRINTSKLNPEPGTSEHELTIDGHTIIISYDVRNSYKETNYHLTSIRIDEPGELTGSGHQVTGRKNVTVNLLNSYGHKNLLLKNGKNVIRICIDPEPFFITKVKINTVEFEKGKQELRYHNVTFREPAAPKRGGKSTKRKSIKNKTKRSKNSLL